MSLKRVIAMSKPMLANVNDTIVKCYCPLFYYEVFYV